MGYIVSCLFLPFQKSVIVFPQGNTANQLRVFFIFSKTQRVAFCFGMGWGRGAGQEGKTENQDATGVKAAIAIRNQVHPHVRLPLPCYVSIIFRKLRAKSIYFH